jgi:trans-aconitate 2-methyltransferase
MRMVINKEQVWAASEYYENSSIQFKASMDLLKEITIRENESILDIGCGDGKITALISKLVPNGNILGIDLSQEMIKFASSKFANSEYPNLSYQHQDARELAFENRFDTIFSSYALHWIVDFENFMRKASRAARKNGRIAFTIPLGISAPLEQATSELMKSIKWSHYFTDYEEPWQFSSQSRYLEMIREAGFEVEKCEEKNHQKKFASRKDIELYIIQWYPYIHQIADNAKSIFYKELMERYFELEANISENHVNFEFPQIDIIAHKS